MGCGWLAGWVMAKIFLSNLQRHYVNKCWKFQEDTLILVWVIAKWLKICCNQWTPNVHQGLIYTLGVHWLQQIFSHLAINQTGIKVSSWNFQHWFITCLCKFDQKILAINQPACQPRPISAKTLDGSSDCICWDILKRKKWWGSGPIEVTSWKEFSISHKKLCLKIFQKGLESTLMMSMANACKQNMLGALKS